MSGLNLQRILTGAVVAAVAFAFDAPRAEAFWRWHGSSGGSWGGSSGGSSGGSWGSSGGSSGGSWGSSGGSSGGYRVRHHRRWHHSSGGCSGGSSGGSSGGWASSGGSYGGSWGGGGGTGSYGSWGSGGGGSYGSGGGSYGYGSGGYEVQSVPMDESAPTPPADAPAPPAEGDMTNLDKSSMMLSVSVPEDAKVFVNNRLTSSTGTVRRFISRGLDPNATYTYEVRAEVIRNGQTETDTKTIKVGGGQVADLAFAFDRTEAEHVAQQPLKTSLILRVPSDAKVFLAGQETKSTGSVREFATTKLPGGGEWSDYSIRVELNRDGQTISKETEVSLSAGESRSVMIDFDATQVAQAVTR